MDRFLSGRTTIASNSTNFIINIKLFIMKRFAVLLILGAFLVGGAMFHSCKKDEMKEQASSENLILKEMSDFGLPIYMAKHTWIGEAEILHTDIGTPDEKIIVKVLLDEALLAELGGWYVTEAHLHAASYKPLKNAPGQFPYHWYAGDGYPIVFEIPVEMSCPGIDWWYALHLELERCIEYDIDGECIDWEDESAWLLPDENGQNWLNKNGKPKGWGQFFDWEFDYTPYISDLDLLVSEDLSYWSYLTEGADGFELCMNGDPNYYYYLNTAFVTALPLVVDNMNPFTMDEVTDPAFWTYWNGKGVNSLAVAGTWQFVMWQIINGDLPIFFVTWDGTDFMLVDGLLWEFAGTVAPLRINGDYPWGVYGYSGTVMGEYCGYDETFYLDVGCPVPPSAPSSEF